MSITEEQLEHRIVPVPEQARALQIVTVADFVAAGELLKVIKGLRAEIDQTFDPIITKAYAAHKEAVAQKKKVDAPLVEAEGILKPRIACFLNEQERLRREEELRLQKLAQEEEELRQLRNAVILDDMGETAEANALLEETPYVPPVVVQRSAPKVSGVSASERWDFDVVDVTKIPREYLVPDLVKIRRMVNAMRSATNIPGIRVKKTTSISARK